MKTSRNCGLAFSIAFSVLSVICFVSEQYAIAVESKAPLLKSTIAIDDALSPMPAALAVGNNFDDSFKVKDADDLWYQVPPWLAGLWKYRANEVATFTDLRTGKTRKEEVKYANVRYKHFGSVKDADGVIWDLAPINLWRSKMYQDLQIDSAMTVTGATKLVDEKTFVIKSVDFDVVSVKGSRKILNASQSESVTTYTKNSDSSISVRSDARHYNAEGNAQFDRVNTYVIEKLRDVDYRADTPPERRAAFVQWLSKRANQK